MRRLLYFKKDSASHITHTNVSTYFPYVQTVFSSSQTHNIKTGYSIFRNSHSFCDLNFSSEITFVNSPKRQRDGMELLT